MLWEPSIIYVFAASCSSSPVHFSWDIFFCNWLCLIVAMCATQFILDILFCCTFCSAMLLYLIVTMCLQLSLSWIFFWVFVVHSLRFQSKCGSNFFWSLNESWKWLFRTSLLTVDCMALSGGGDDQQVDKKGGMNGLDSPSTLGRSMTFPFPHHSEWKLQM